MADLTVTVFNPVLDNAQIPPQMLSAPVATDLSAGTPVKFNATSGKFEAMSSTDAVGLFAGLLMKTTKAGYVGTAFRGLAYMDGLTSLNIGQYVTLSSTAGKLSDSQAASSKAVGRLVPLHESGGTFKKMVEIFNVPLVI